jgi:hypothetical protein
VAPVLDSITEVIPILALFPVKNDVIIILSFDSDVDKFEETVSTVLLLPLS